MSFPVANYALGGPAGLVMEQLADHQPDRSINPLLSADYLSNIVETLREVRNDGMTDFYLFKGTFQLAN